MTEFKLFFTKEALADFSEIQSDPAKTSIAKATLKCLNFMKVNIKHPSLKTHKYKGHKGPSGEDIFESYVQNNTPGAYRIFWFYGPEKNEITILQIIPHP